MHAPACCSWSPEHHGYKTAGYNVGMSSAGQATLHAEQKAALKTPTPETCVSGFVTVRATRDGAGRPLGVSGQQILLGLTHVKASYFARMQLTRFSSRTVGVRARPSRAATVLVRADGVQDLLARDRK